MFRNLQATMLQSIADISSNTTSLEKMNPSVFKRNYEAFRTALIPGRITNLSTLQLPNKSTLHTINHFLDPHASDNCNIDTTNPLIKNEQWSMYLRHQIKLPTKTTLPFPVADQYTYVPNRYLSQTVSFFQHQHHIRRALSETSLANLPNVLILNEYAAINHVRLTGQLATYRHFDIILRTMLDQICNNGDTRYHFLQFPLSHRIYIRAQFMQTFDRLAVSTLKILNDPSYFLLVHLLGLVYGEQNDEPKALLPHADLALLPKNVEPPTLTSTSLFARVPDDVLARLHIILTVDDHAIIYNLGELKEMARTTPLFLRVLRHVTILKSHANKIKLPNDDVDDLKFDTEIAEQQTEHDEASTSHDTPPVTDVPPIVIQHPMINKTEEVDLPPIKEEYITTTNKKPVVKTETTTNTDDTKNQPKPSVTIDQKKIPHQSYKNHVETILKEKIATTAELSDIPHNKVDELYQRHLAVVLEGKTLGQHLETILPDVHTNTLDFLKEKLPDSSMSESSIANIDTLYIKHGLHHDLAKTLTSFVAQGLFVTNIESVPEYTEWTRRVVYKVALVDVHGKRHSITFALPEVDAAGQMMINGVQLCMTKQQINLPICKVAPDRVNLSSNFNKTMVQRTKTRRHNFSSYITTYFSALHDSGYISVQYGNLSNDPTILPYDYSAIGQTYAKIAGKAGWLQFDYTKRFDFLTNDLNSSHEDYDTTSAGMPPQLKKEDLVSRERHYGIFFGKTTNENSSNDLYLFMGLDNKIREVSIGTTDTVAKSTLTITELLNTWYPEVALPKPVSEWTELKILDENFPIIFILGFHFGLSAVLKQHPYLHAKWIPLEEKYTIPKDSFAVKFADGNLIFSRYPVESSLILAGLLKYPTEHYYRAEFDTPDVYYRILTEAGISSNYLKGIRNFFDFFLDPITIDVLHHMGEPVTVTGLLLRANQMLSSYEHYDSASMRNHRLRGYERFASVLYNEVARQLATYQNKRTHRKSFSINPESVFQRLAQDPTMSSVETINPIYEIRTNTSLTYAGSGGRTTKSFVVEDRRYPADGVGILSEATPDSGKVAMNAYTSIDPKLANLRGMFSNDNKKLTPSNILSVTALLFPCATQDDGKRGNYASVQIAHHVPCQASEVSRVRTGYETVVAHRCSEDFSCVAKQDGRVIEIDETLHVLKVEYVPQTIQTDGARQLPYTETDLKQALAHNTPIVVLMSNDELNQYPPHKVFSVSNGVNAQLTETIIFSSLQEVPDKSARRHMTNELMQQLKTKETTSIVYARFVPIATVAKPVIDLFQYGEHYTNVSGSYIQQNLVLNVTHNEKFKRGDVLAYNEGFFSPDLDSKQVLWKHGCMPNVALIEMGTTLEDSSCITRELGEQLSMSPAHVRQIELTSTTVLHQVVEIGEHVETTDPLCIIEESDLDALAGIDDTSTLSFLSILNKKTLQAKYHGRIAAMELYYSCHETELHPSLAKLAKTLIKRKRAYAEQARSTLKNTKYGISQHVPPGTKYRGILFEKDTVLLLITITENLAAGCGDKIVLGLQAKSVIGTVLEKQPFGESGTPVDVIFSSSSISKRILSSPYLIGIGNRILEKLESLVVDSYFNEK